MRQALKAGYSKGAIARAINKSPTRIQQILSREILRFNEDSKKVSRLDP